LKGLHRFVGGSDQVYFARLAHSLRRLGQLDLLDALVGDEERDPLPPFRPNASPPSGGWSSHPSGNQAAAR
jgi:hypothetical protein